MAAKASNLIQQDLKKGDTNFGISIYFANAISGNVLEIVNHLRASLKGELLELDKKNG